VLQQAQRLLRVLACQAAQAQADHIGRGTVGLIETTGLGDCRGILGDLLQQGALLRQARQVFDQEGQQAEITLLGGQFGTLPTQRFTEQAFLAPALKQRIAGIVLRFADQPEFFCLGPCLRQQVGLIQVQAIQAVQLREVQRGIIVSSETLPFTAFSQPTQPTQLHPADLRKVAVFDEKLLDFIVTGPFQAMGQLVIGEVRGQRIVAQGLGVAFVGSAVALGQGALGFIVEQALLGQGVGLGAGQGE